MIHFSLRNPFVANLVMVVVVVVGVLSWQKTPQEIFPVIPMDKIEIATSFEGASPSEVERQVTLSIEEEVNDLPDIKNITSTSREGSSNIRIELLENADVDDMLQRVRDEVQAMDNLPEAADDPLVTRIKSPHPLINVSVYGEVSEFRLQLQAEELRRQLLTVPGVSEIRFTTGDRDWEMWVQIDPRQLAALGVSLEEVRRALRDNLSDTPGGTIYAQEGDILLRGYGAKDLEAIGNVVVRGNPQGGQLRLRDLALINMELEEVQTAGRFNGAPAIGLYVFKTEYSSSAVVVQRIRDFLANTPRESDIKYGLFRDTSVWIERRLQTLKSAGVVALLLLLLAMNFLLNFRTALITALGIPVAMLTGVILVSLAGHTINLVSATAFLVALGLVVDDAIIIAENSYRHLEEGIEPHVAAERGAKEVMWPVIAAVLTSAAAFLPMFNIGGILGKYVEVIPIVVIAALAGSLMEVFLIMPSHAAELLRLQHNRRRDQIWKIVHTRYCAVLDHCIHNRYLVLLGTIGILVIVLIWGMTRLSYSQFPGLDLDEFSINIEAPSTYGLRDTTLLAERVESALSEVLREDEVLNIQTNIGFSMFGEKLSYGGNQLNINVELTPSAPEGWLETYVNPVVSLNFDAAGTRERRNQELRSLTRERLKAVTGIQRLLVMSPEAGPPGADIEIGLVGQDFEVLLAEAEVIKDFLRQIEGVEDVQHNLMPGKVEYQYTLNDRGRELGLTQSALGAAVRVGYQGDRVLYTSFQGHRIPVRLLYEPSTRGSSADFGKIPVVVPDGVVYLEDVADIEATRSLTSVHRRDGQRMITVSADVDERTTTAGIITDLVDQELGERFAYRDDVELTYLGEKQEALDATTDMQFAVTVALILIFFILALLFKSVLDPLVVMFSIPFCLVGVVLGHSLLGIHVQFLSLVGILALIGVVVNDSLVLINFAEEERRKGIERMEAVLHAGRARFRPILLTSVTTFLGVSPLIFFASGQTRILTPMAASLGFGLLFATFLILLALPCIYLIVDDLRLETRVLWRKLQEVWAA